MTPPIELLSAVTLASTDMERSLRFYRTLGFVVRDGRDSPAFCSLAAGPGALNLQLVPDYRPPAEVWGRVILWVDDVDAVHDRAVAAGYEPSTLPADAPWGERYFHISDPDGHELSFAAPL